MKLFVVTDVHGHGTALRSVLEKAGFVAGAKDHLLISCGDCFDRGRENLDVLTLLESIPNKVLIRGNHEQMLGDMMANGRTDPIAEGNGTCITLREFFGEDAIAEDGTLRMPASKKRRVKRFLDDMVDYYETKHYLFVHGWVPLGMRDGCHCLERHWRQSPPCDLHWSRWNDWHQLYGYAHLAPPADKTMVCGHRSAMYGVYFDRERPADSTLPFFGRGLIALDASTAMSGRINLLVLEDQLLTREHHMKLDAIHFDAIRAGKKTVEMRLLDERREDLRIGETVTFLCNGREESLSVRVMGLYSYPDFETLVQDYRPSALGFAGKKSSYIARYMRAIYGKEKCERYRALAIRVKL